MGETLTPSQNEAFSSIKESFRYNRGICVSGGGRKKVINKYLEKYEENQILKLEYFDIFDGSVKDGPSLYKKISGILSKLGMNTILRIIYIEGFDLLVSATSNYNFKIGTISIKIWHDLFNKIDRKFIISCSKHTALDLVDEGVWFVNIETTNEDRLFLLDGIFEDYIRVNKIETKELLSYVGNSTLKTIKIAACQTVGRLDCKLATNPQEEFKKILFTLDSRALDVRNRVVQPILEVDMVGLDSIIDELRMEIIHPIKLGCKEVPICKGMLLYGPAGTGKSTVGRWLSHELQGRFYLAKTSSSDTLISSFTRLLKIACNNTPSVVFLDDFESILESPTYVRELLVLLDGIDVNGRENVCVVATCMNIGSIPEDLIRGFRLEKCIEFSCPDHKTITLILKNRFSKIIETTENKILSGTLSNLMKHGDLSNLSRYLSGWPPSNIQLLINSLIRKITYRNSELKAIEEINNLFKDESYRINQNIQRSLRRLNNTKTVDDRIYN